MSKATFYEHFANKEECILALVEAAGAASRAAVAAAADAAEENFEAKVHARVHRFLAGLALFPEMARVVMVDVIGVGPVGAAKRDEMLQAFGDFLVEENQRAHDSYGAPKFVSPDDAYAMRRGDHGARLAAAAHRRAEDHGRARARHRADRRRRPRAGRGAIAAGAWAVRTRSPAAGRARAARHGLPRLPAARGLARGGRRGQARGVRRPGVLGPADPGLRRPGRDRAAARPRPRRARRQPDRARVHRRPLGRLPLRRAAPHRASPTSRRPSTAATASRSGAPGSPRPSAARRRPTSRRRPSATAACRGRARSSTLLPDVRVVVCLGAFGWDAALRLLEPRAAPAEAEVRPRRRGGRRRLDAARLLPPEPAEHVHRGADAGHARRGAAPRARPRRPLKRIE